MSVVPRILVKYFNRRFCSVLYFNKRYSTNPESKNNDIKSQFTDVNIPRITFTEFVLSSIGKYSNLVATQCGITGRKYTYDDILIKATNLNKSLRKKLKLRRNDVVALLLPNIPEYPICVLGALLAGLKLTTLNPGYTSDEIKRQLVDSNAKVLITLPELWNNANKAVGEINAGLNIITIKNAATDATPRSALDFQEAIDAMLDLPDVELTSYEDTIFMPYSSGTTGLPKGVELSSYNIVANISQMNHNNLKVILPATESHQDVTVAVLPLFHIYGFASTFMMMSDGVKIVTLPKFTPDGYLSSLREYKPHILMIVPPIVIFLSTHPDVKAEYFSSLRTVNSGAAPLGALDENKFRERVGRPINVLQGYGLSETSPVVTLVPLSLQGKYPGSMGTILPNTIAKVIDPEDKEGKHIGPNKIGELLIKGPQVMKGYHNKPKETADAFLDGWFRTGDLVRYDEHQMFYIADRIKELIKVRAYQVAPAELEEIIRDFPGVAEAAVIGIPHKYHGEVPRAYIVAKENTTIDIKKLKEHVESKVSKHKRLEGGIAVVENIQKNASGKILRRQLKLKFAEEGI